MPTLVHLKVQKQCEFFGAVVIDATPNSMYRALSASVCISWDVFSARPERDGKDTCIVCLFNRWSMCRQQHLGVPETGWCRNVFEKVRAWCGMTPATWPCIENLCSHLSHCGFDLDLTMELTSSLIVPLVNSVHQFEGHFVVGDQNPCWSSTS